MKNTSIKLTVVFLVVYILGTCLSVYADQCPRIFGEESRILYPFNRIIPFSDLIEYNSASYSVLALREDVYIEQDKAWFKIKSMGVPIEIEIAHWTDQGNPIIVLSAKSKLLKSTRDDLVRLDVNLERISDDGTNITNITKTNPILVERGVEEGGADEFLFIVDGNHRYTIAKEENQHIFIEVRK